MIRRLARHISSLKEWYIWTPLLLVGPFILGKIAQYLNHGRPLLDDPTSIYSDALLWVPVNISLITAAMYSKYLNNSLTPEQYTVANWKDKLVDNLPELIVFIVVLVHFHLQS